VRPYTPEVDLLRRWLAWFSEDDPRNDLRYGTLISIVNETIRLLEGPGKRKCVHCGHDCAMHYDGEGCIGLGCTCAAQNPPAALPTVPGARPGRGAEFPQDDGTTVVDVFGAVCRCDPDLYCATSPNKGQTWICTHCGEAR
jgi:hypothetical protein